MAPQERRRLKPMLTTSPQSNINSALKGAVSVDELSKAERSALQLPIYNLAVDVLALYDKQARRGRLNEFPVDIKTLVETEAKRLWKLRKNNHARK